MNRGQLLEAAFRTIHDDIVDGLATGGSATTIVDTAIANKYAANKFRNWVEFITRTTDGLTPQNKYSTISASTRAGTITFATMTTLAGAGDEYSLVKASVPIYTAERLSNDALSNLGFAFHRQDTSLTTATNTLQYTLPIATKGRTPQDVYLIDSNNIKSPAPVWDVISAAGGSTETLNFHTQPTVGKTIVVDYLVEHAELTAYSDSVDEHIADALAVAAVVERFLDWKVAPRMRQRDKDLHARALSRLAELKQQHPIRVKPRKEQFLRVNLYN